jgi:uncharacterized membrane protein
MTDIAKFFHLIGAIVWLGGMAFVIFAFRPAITTQLQAPLRLLLLSQTLTRFFMLVWLSIALLLVTGLAMLANVGMKAAPLGWHLMFGIGLLMFLVFGHIYFGPFRRLKLATSASDWPQAGLQAGKVARLVWVNFVLGWVAIAAVVFVS